MKTVRRWYLFLVCAVSLQALAWAVIWLLRGMLLPSLRADAELFSVQIAIIVLGMPIFLWHWSKARGQARPRAEDGRVELGPFPLYLYGMLAGFIAPMAANAVTLLQVLFRIILGLGDKPLSSDLLPAEAGVHAGVALAVLAGLTLVFRHLERRAPSARDTVAGYVPDVRRAFLLALSVAGLSLTVASLIGLLRWLLFQIGADGVGIAGGGEVVPVQAARLLVGLPLWQLPWQRAQALFFSGGADERESALRKLYLYALVFIGSLTVVTTAATVLAGVLRGWLGLPSSGELRTALTAMAVFGLAWAYHALALQRDADLAPDVPTQAAIRRLYRYILATIGLGALLIGVGGDISALILMVRENGFGDGLREQVSGASAALVAGLPVWLLPWRKAQLAAQSAGAAGRVERRATVRKVYLYLFLFVATMTVLSSAVVILSQLLNLVLGEKAPQDLPSVLAHAIAFGAMAAGLWVYHRARLREDGEQEEAEQREQAADVRVAILTSGDEELGAALDSALREEMPGLRTERAESADAIAGLSPNDVVVAPGDAAGMVTDSPARKLLLPLPRLGWDWVGAPLRTEEAAIKETAQALRQLIAGEGMRPRGRLGGGARIALAIGALLLLAMFVVPLIMSIVGAD